MDSKIETSDKYGSLPLDINQDPSIVETDFKRRDDISIKSFLLNQFTKPSGIGNYLACEICAYANIYPNIQLHLLTNNHIQALNMALKQVHLYAMKSPKYDWFLVFNQEFCQSCFAPVIRQKFKSNEQTTHWCKCCQL